MRKVFTNPSRLTCIFTEDGISLYGDKQEIFYPYGAIDSVKMSLLGILQAVHHTQILSFAVERADRAAMKEMVAYAREAMKTAPAASPVTVDVTPGRVSADLPAEEQLKQYKTLYISGAISKDAYNLKKRLLQTE